MHKNHLCWKKVKLLITGVSDASWIHVVSASTPPDQLPQNGEKGAITEARCTCALTKYSAADGDLE